jgi:hypothetical protein
MIDLLLKLLEKLGQLAEYRSARQKRAFKEMAEPMFNELLEVHKDYIRIFTEARSLVETSPNAEPALQYLERKRMEFEPVRVKLRTMAQTVFHPSPTSEMDAFLNAVANYFPVGDIFIGHGTASTTLIRELRQQIFPVDFHKSVLVSIWNEEMPGPGQKRRTASNPPKDDPTRWATETIDRYVELLQQKWKGVCEAFATVKSADLAL